MSKPNATQAELLSKLGISSLNEMQVAAAEVVEQKQDLVLLSPTGTGKTLAFLLPVLARLKSDASGIQALILVPSRELAMQIEQVLRSLGSGFKVNAVYGGRSGAQDRIDLAHTPAILVGTPGRVADHIRTETIDVKDTPILVLDEFDKSLEVGFESDMRQIVDAMDGLDQRILTSATKRIAIPDFVRIEQAEWVDFLGEQNQKLKIFEVKSTGEKVEALIDLLNELAGKPGIVFFNFRDSVAEASKLLHKAGVPHGQFFGTMEQRDREKSLIKFRNGTHRLILATDLAARGLDIPELAFIVHFELPENQTAFTHRNGRTARMNKEGAAYVVLGQKDRMPGYVEGAKEHETTDAPASHTTDWCTLYISGGRRDKISKGDIAGLFFKQGGLAKDEMGLIELKQTNAFVAVKKDKYVEVIERTTNTRLKKKKVRVSRA